MTCDAAGRAPGSPGFLSPKFPLSSVPPQLPLSLGSFKKRQTDDVQVTSTLCPHVSARDFFCLLPSLQLAQAEVSDSQITGVGTCLLSLQPSPSPELWYQVSCGRWQLTLSLLKTQLIVSTPCSHQSLPGQVHVLVIALLFSFSYPQDSAP